jgi:hypothetical protein
VAWLDNLREYFPLNEASGDSVGLHNGHMLSDTNLVGSGTGRTYGVAREFLQGSSQLLSMLDHADVSFGDYDWTVGFEILFYDTASFDYGLIQKGSDSEWKIQKNSGNQFDFYIWNGGTNQNLASSLTVSAFTWYGVLMAYNSVANQMRLSINNASAETTPWSLGAPDGSGDFKVGSNAMNGLIGPIALWNRLLTAPEEAAWPLTYVAMGGGGGGGPSFNPAWARGSNVYLRAAA